jgi:hypothetical protein
MAGRFPFRLFPVLVLAIALAIPVPYAVAEGTPADGPGNPFADLGLPQIDITMTDTAFEGVPATLTAGRHVVALTNATSIEGEPSGGTFLRLPDGMDADAFLEMVAGPEASPVAEMGAEGSPAAAEDEVPMWFFEVVMAGGPFADPGATAYAVVELTPGEWIFWAESSDAPQGAVQISVTGEAPADSPLPTPGIRLEMSDFAFTFDGPVSAGPVVIELANTGDQPHFVIIAQVPDGTTVDDVMGLLEQEFTGATPAPDAEGGLAFEDVIPVFNHGNQSAGTTAWYADELQAGTHVAVCFIPDLETGMPHVMLGMIEVFEVS